MSVLLSTCMKENPLFFNYNRQDVNFISDLEIKEKKRKDFSSIYLQRIILLSRVGGIYLLEQIIFESFVTYVLQYIKR